MSTSKAPLLMVTCSEDVIWTTDLQAKTEELMGDGKFAPGYRREYYEGCHHGFTTRGDINDPVVKAAKEDAFKKKIEWFIKYL
jgi:dienelactone hydrolase